MACGVCGSSLVQFEVTRDDFSPIMKDKKLNRTQFLIFEELQNFWHVPNSSKEHWMFSDLVRDKECYISDIMSHWLGWFILDMNRKNQDWKKNRGTPQRIWAKFGEPCVCLVFPSSPLGNQPVVEKKRENVEKWPLMEMLEAFAEEEHSGRLWADPAGDRPLALLPHS